MASTLFYPDLKIVPISGIKLQEYIQKDRMQALASAIKREAMLKNPPIVTNFFNGDYLHLDGANRITAVLSYRIRIVLCRLLIMAIRRMSICRVGAIWHMSMNHSFFLQ